MNLGKLLVLLVLNSEPVDQSELSEDQFQLILLITLVALVLTPLAES